MVIMKILAHNDDSRYRRMSNYGFAPEEQLMLARIDFGIPKRGFAKTVDGVVEDYLAALFNNGQIGSGYLIQEGPNWAAYVQATDAGALDPPYLSPWGKKHRDNLLLTFGHGPKLVLLEPPLKRRRLSWRSAKSLFIHTEMFKSGSPVGSPELHTVVPVYQLPISYQDRDYLIRWTNKYRDHDSIWVGSGKLEVAAYREMADPRSQLSREGRGYCQIIEKATGIPTYYYLFRYYGRSKGEAKRRCPLCGQNWRTRSPKGVTKFSRFEFRCIPCRLVSSMADSVGDEEDERLAIIGEPRQSIRQKSGR